LVKIQTEIHILALSFGDDYKRAHTLLFPWLFQQSNLSKQNPFETEEFVQFRQVFGLHRFKSHRHWVDRTVKSVWFRQVISLLSVQLRQVFGLHRFKLHRHLVDGTVKSVWFKILPVLRQDFCLLSVRFRQISLYSRGLFCLGFENINRQNKNKMRWRQIWMLIFYSKNKWKSNVRL
jgi:hypothetical protein